MGKVGAASKDYSKQKSSKQKSSAWGSKQKQAQATRDLYHRRRLDRHDAEDNKDRKKSFASQFEQHELEQHEPGLGLDESGLGLDELNRKRKGLFAQFEHYDYYGESGELGKRKGISEQFGTPNGKKTGGSELDKDGKVRTVCNKDSEFGEKHDAREKMLQDDNKQQRTTTSNKTATKDAPAFNATKQPTDVASKPPSAKGLNKSPKKKTDKSGSSGSATKSPKLLCCGCCAPADDTD